MLDVVSHTLRKISRNQNTLILSKVYILKLLNFVAKSSRTNFVIVRMHDRLFLKGNMPAGWLRNIDFAFSFGCVTGLSP